MPKATCPTDPTHTRFATSAAVMETWLVDEAGNWLATLSQDEVLHKPEAGNTWTCTTCNAEATVA